MPEQTLDEKQYLQILDTAPDAMVVVGADQTIVFVNVQTEKLFGYDRRKLLGSPLDTLIPLRARKSHGGHVSRYFARPGVRPMGSGLELFGLRADGTEMAIEVSLSPVAIGQKQYVSAAIRDISERKRMEAAAKLSAERLASAVESIQDALALFDANDVLVLCNSAYRRLLGERAPGTLVGRSFDDLLRAWTVDLEFADPDAAAKFVADRIAERRSGKAAFDVRSRDGRSFRVTDRPTTEGGIVETIWDLSDDMRREQELREARAAAEGGSKAKSEFLSSMSHELRTPLNAILGFAQLLQRDKKEPLGTRHKDRVEQILRGGEHLLRLIDDILDLSRIEAGAVSISVEPVSVPDVLGGVSTTLEALAMRSGVQLEKLPAAEGLPMVAADRTRLAQILMNFGSNAIKYNRPHGTVSFVVAKSDDAVRISVRDTGMGIPLEKQDKLFQPFQRAGQETGPIEGTGIGLVITRRLAELMNATVGFESVEGRGSTFWVEVPVFSRPASSVAARERARDVDAPSLDTQPRRLVLYVEDNPANVTFMRDVLADFENIEVAIAPTAEMGVELARARHPHVIIMDINLPGMSGLDALHALRDIPETRAIPVIALTAAASERDRQRGKQAGFASYLTKPVDVDELVGALERALSSMA